MARARDEAKRGAILLAAKHLFARHGFHKTSISDIKRESGLPVGSIYTYFGSKDDIMSTIIDEGWQELYNRVDQGFNAATTTDARIRILTDAFFSELVHDTDLISILLTEAIELTRIGAKLDLIMQLVLRLTAVTDQAQLRTAVVVYFLGFLNAARLSLTGQLGISLEDVRSMMKQLIESSLATLSPPAKVSGPQ